MGSFIANQVKTTMCSVSVKLFIVHTTFESLFTRNWYNTNNNTKYLFNTTISYSPHNCNSFCSHATCVKTASITTELLIALSCPFIVQHF